MKIALFTSNQPRHVSLINQLSSCCDSLYVVSEVTTIFPGETQDFYNSSPIMKEYFSLMRKAEENIFSKPGFLNKNIHLFPIKMGDVSSIPLSTFQYIDEMDYIIVFGASWIRGPLCQKLIQKNAVNIHMGISPYYRGAACNFWALYDKNPEYVGATLHYLSEGLDSGRIISHVFPNSQNINGFDLGMLSVKSAHEALVRKIMSNTLCKIKGLEQNKKEQLRYSRRSEFTDEIVSEYIKNQPTPDFIQNKCANRDLSLFFNPVII